MHVRRIHPLHPRSAGRSHLPGGAWIGTLAVTAGSAAFASYGLHHLGPLDQHAPMLALLALTLTALAAAALGATVTPKPPTASVIVLRGGPPTITALESSEAEFCASLHAAALSHGFFVTLGDRFLSQYYRAFADSPHAVAMVATVDGHPVGYLVGCVRARAHRQWVLKNRGVRLATSAAAALSVRPALAVRFARTRLRRYREALRRTPTAPSGGTQTIARDVAVLSHVAVLEGARHTGAGTLLVAAFEEAAREAGTSVAFLTTLVGAEGAGPFYERCGWRGGPSHLTPDGLAMQEWTKTLTPRSVS
ncbi:hypothetical protein C7Y72_11870 [Paraconexibacter algicola]|uniref:N-acetyltransferase domain-containing protein n=1 Tax=Paraconexibacter algicola TaxID=2133960 RepID=A0A2T4UNN1_9ACTN|nr:hypothetical protein C7Y72_11870 [Paraconexibacter algicola]